jgi:5-methylcytosine-specific restriction endonuclease McrA
VPPRPRSFDSRNPGHCKFCGEAIRLRNGKVNKRASWHPHCAITWTIMNNPQQARRMVFVRDRGYCCDCGKDCFNGSEAKRQETVNIILHGSVSGMALDVRAMPLGTWEVDHDIPLWVAPSMGNPPELWMLPNMRTRCPECHKIKTKADEEKYASTRESP